MSPLFPNLVAALTQHADGNHDRLACGFLPDGEGEALRWTFGDLDSRARAIAVALLRRGAPGDRALLLYPPGLDFVAAFLGCLYARVVAVPSYPPAAGRPGRGQARLRSIAEDSEPRWVLFPAALRPRVEAVAAKIPGLAAAEPLATDEVPLAWGEEWREVRIDREDLAFLQYTSGSTSEPKGVRVSHGNLAHNQEVIRRACGHDERATFVSWLPIYHDMGLIGSLLQPLYVGASCILMAPVAFLHKPVRWLRAISEWRAQTSGAPDFAYDLCVRKIAPEQREGLNLSSWRTAFDGSEPVRERTVRAFADAFGPFGFRAEAFFPCYGLAEATLIVSGGSGGAPPLVDAFRGLDEGRAIPSPDADDARLLVGCGEVGADLEVAIVDPQTLAERQDDRVGEIWVSGPSVAQGYWNRPEISRETFGARLPGRPGRTFLRTGDLGFLWRRQLFVAGRIKDLIIVRGRNHYPQDLEASVADSHPALRGGAGAAFAVDPETDGGVAIVAEIDIRRRPDPTEALAAARRAVGEEHEIPLAALVLVRPGSIPKTTSGKVRRRLCRSLFLTGGLDVVAQWRGAAEDAEASAAPEPFEVAGWLRARLAAKLGVAAPESLDEELPLASHGLDSLAAVELAHEIESAYGIELPLAALLDSPGLGDLARRVEEARRSAPASESAVSQADAGRLSPGESALWFLQQADPDDPASHIFGAARLAGEVDERSLARSLSAIVARHPALRSRFALREGRPVRSTVVVRQVPQRLAAAEGARRSEEADETTTRSTADDAEEVLSIEEASAWSEAELLRRLDAEVFRPFDLERGPLLRALLLRRSPAERVLLLTVHHIVADFWSLALIARELGESYAAGGRRLGPAPGGAERGSIETLDGPRETYWRRALAEVPLSLALPFDRPLPARRRHRAGAVIFGLGGATSDRLRALGRERGATLFVALLAAYQAVLHGVTGQERLVVGSPTAGRDRAADAEKVGYFVNPLALVSDMAGDPPFERFLAVARRTVVEAIGQAVPFPLLVARLQPERDPVRSPIFQAALALQRAPRGEEALAAFALGEEGGRLETGGLVLQSMALAHRPAQFDLSLVAAEREGEVRATLLYDLELFDRSTAIRFAALVERSIAAFVEAPGLRWSEVPVWNAAERWQLLGEWNEPEVEPSAGLVAERIAAQALRRPGALAVRQGGKELTYGQLATSAAHLAARLRALGAGLEAPVAILAERSPEQIAGLLAAFFVGAPYLPIDPAYPAERIAWMLADSKAAVLLAEGRWLSGLPPVAVPVVRLDEPPGAEAEGAFVPAAVLPGQLAYVIYTSGSTGRPKGVAISHAALAGLIDWHVRVFEVTERDVASQVAGLGFDAAVWEVWPYLCAGAGLRLPEDEEVRTSPGRLRDWLSEQRVSIAFVPTALIGPLTALGGEPASSPRLLLTGGDRLVGAPPPGLPYSLWNNYGPTECTVVATSGRVAPAEAPGRAPSLGRPIAGVRVYLLGSRSAPVPWGAPGEIFLGGDRLARGYLSRPDLTAERFVPDPFGSAGGRLYRTGDLARWNPDGSLEFFGRIDAQVQIRGVRIEPGEIEAVLREHGQVTAAVVVAVDGGEGRQRLVAFAVPRASANPTLEELRDHLRDRLPPALVPAAVRLLPSLPLTANGKLDRQALALEAARSAAGGAVPPRSPLEDLLWGIWADLLPVGGFGVHDDFFALGGHSLLAVQVASRVRSALGIEISVRALFEAPTIAQIADRVAGASRLEKLPPRPFVRGPKGVDLPLSFAQQRLWFLHQLDPRGATYNVPGALGIDGDLDVSLLGRALREIVRRHDALRTTFHLPESGAGTPVQRVSAAIAVRLPVADLRGLAAERREPEAGRLAVAEGRRAFDLLRGPVLRFFLVRLAPAGYRLVVVLHHVVADGWSLGVLLRELGSLYPALAAGGAGTLRDLEWQVADFAVWQRRWLDERALGPQLEAWRRRLAGLEPLLALPTDRPHPARPGTVGSVFRFTLPTEAWAPLEDFGRRRGASLFMAVLAGWAALLVRYTGQTDLAVGAPVANRNRTEVEDLIGCFVNTLVLRVPVPPRAGLATLLGEVRQVVLDALEHQDLPFERLVEALHPDRDLAHSPLFQVIFALQNAALPALRLPGLDLALLPVDIGRPKFDLAMILERRDARLEGGLEYRTELFDESTIARLVRHLERLLVSAVAEPARPLGDLPMLGDDELLQLLAERQPELGLEAGAPEPLLHRRFEAWAEGTPDAVAAVCGDRALSYGELDRRANRLANRLRERGVRPGARVAIWLERSVEVAIGILGALKAGAAWLPLDQAYPLDRLAFMVADGGASALVTSSLLLGSAAVLDAGLTDVARVVLDADAGGEEAPLSLDLPGSSLAYLLYTSGSTGQPKGVCCTHVGAAAMIDDFSVRSPLPVGTIYSLWANLSFDASVYEIFSAWFGGGRLEIVPDEARTQGESFTTWLEDRQVESAFVAPTMLVAIAEVLASRPIPLRRLLVGAETIPEPLLAGLGERRAGLRVFNGYGPTETAVCVTFQQVQAPARERNAPVGWPVRGSRVYLLGPDGELVPPGVPGEVHIAGISLAWGYLGRSALTSECFVPDPFGARQETGSGARMYRTRDLARHLPDGSLAFVGRIDRQLKIRGVRLEPGEIEEMLRELPEVRDVAVGARRSLAGDLRLVAWVVPAAPLGDVGLLREILRSRMPEVMVPSAFVALAALPLTVNGKVDRDALPDPDWRRLAGGGTFVAPRTLVEEMLAEIWAELLELERIGIHDGFFDVGGHSLKAGQLVSRIHGAFGVDLPIRTVFEAPTIAAQALAIGVRLVEQADPETLAQTLSEL